MNRFSLQLDYDGEGGLAADPAADFSDGHLRIKAENLHPPLRLHRQDGRVIALIGNPIAEGRRDDEAVLLAYRQAADFRDFLSGLNGSFLVIVYNPRGATLAIGNDRFASLALYHSRTGSRFSAALSLKQLYDARSAAGRAALDPEAVFEFLYFRRLFGERSLDRDVAYLASAACLTIDPDLPEPRIEKYWQPGYASKHPGGQRLVIDLAEALRDAVAMATSDEQRFGLLLSGGLDSRALLAAAGRPMPCLTTALQRNNEAAVAAEVAAAAGAPHHFIPRPPGLYDPVIDDAVFLTGGMQLYSETHFLGYGPAMLPLADSLLIGLGLDIFFAGLYLPKDTATLFGRPALHHRLRSLSDDLAGDFISGVKYRLRSSDPFRLVKAGMRERLAAHLRQVVEEILERGRALGAEGYDLWEYMHLHNLSRHYSFPMMSAIRSFADCRAPALENRLFDLAIAMTAAQKLDGTPYQEAVTLLSPAVMAVRNANTNLPAAYSLRRQTLVKAVKMAGNRLFGTAYPQSPGWQERSWPSPKAALEANPGIHARIRALPGSERLAALDFLDMDALAGLLEEHEAGRHDHAICLNVLLTIERFLEPTPAAGRDALASGPASATLRRRSAR